MTLLLISHDQSFFYAMLGKNYPKMFMFEFYESTTFGLGMPAP